MFIACELDLCIYHRCGMCSLSNFSINALGMCENAVLIDVEEEDLNYYKVKTLEKWQP